MFWETSSPHSERRDGGFPVSSPSLSGVGCQKLELCPCPSQPHYQVNQGVWEGNYLSQGSNVAVEGQPCMLCAFTIGGTVPCGQQVKAEEYKNVLIYWNECKPKEWLAALVPAQWAVPCLGVKVSCWNESLLSLEGPVIFVCCCVPSLRPGTSEQALQVHPVVLSASCSPRWVTYLSLACFSHQPHSFLVCAGGHDVFAELLAEKWSKVLVQKLCGRL